MTQQELDRRCKEAIMQTKKETPVVVVGILAGLKYRMKERDLGNDNLELLGQEIGRAYVGLKMLEKFYNIEPQFIEKGIEDALTYG